ncbi:MAG TPA: hypothetical protein PLW10_13255, partial [Myxococcota bacterium]|nr:hypothetical protein [Myxococcota bacterium]
MEGRIGRVDWRLLDEERRAWEQDGFFAREAVFAADELEILRAAAERVVAAATRATLEVVADPATALDPSLDYEIDGNRYVEAARSTVQFEHERGSSTIRVIEPFHHLDPVLDGLLGDARIVAPLCG